MGDGYKRFFWWLCLVTATVFVVYEVAVGHWLLALVATIIMVPTLATGGLGWQHPPGGTAMTDTTLLRVCWGFGAFGMVVLTALEWARGDWWTPLPVWLTCGLVLWAARGVWRAPPAPARPREDDGAPPR